MKIKDLEIDCLEIEANGNDIYGYIDAPDGLQYWGAITEKKYNETEEAISSFEIKRYLWEIALDFDVSGFDYWMNSMKEFNTCSGSVWFKTEELTASEVKELQKDVWSALEAIESIHLQGDGFCDINDYWDNLNEE